MRRLKGTEINERQIIKDYKKVLKNFGLRERGKLLVGVTDIARKHHCTTQRVYQILKDRGVKIFDKSIK